MRIHSHIFIDDLTCKNVKYMLNTHLHTYTHIYIQACTKTFVGTNILIVKSGATKWVGSQTREKKRSFPLYNYQLYLILIIFIIFTTKQNSP